MKKSSTLSLFSLLIFSVCLVFLSCQKNIPTTIVPPVVSAGNTQNIQLPLDSVTLTGSVTNTNSKIVGYLWSEVSGPNVPVIASESSPSTIVRGMVAGSYKFQFMAIDSLGLTGVDTVSVIVLPPIVDSLVLQPTNNPTEINLGLYNSADRSGSYIELPAATWTDQGLTWIIRPLFQFDLSSIKSNATILSANLYLYSDSFPQNGNKVDANYGTNNSLYLQQVSTSWSMSNINWFNQPSVYTNNQISIPSTTSNFLNLNIDVTNMVSSQVTNNANYGFILRLQNEVLYTSRIFCSSSYSDATRHPKLVVYYEYN